MLQACCRQNLPNRQCQQGSALLLAVFIMVVVMLLGTTLVRVLSTGSETIAQEVLGTRALAAANSAMQGQLAKLFPLNGVAPSFSCDGSAIPSYDFTAVQGLEHCSAIVSCSTYATVDTVNYYRLTSTGSCGTGTMEAGSNAVVLSSRTVQVDARDL